LIQVTPRHFPDPCLYHTQTLAPGVAPITQADRDKAAIEAGQDRRRGDTASLAVLSRSVVNLEWREVSGLFTFGIVSLTSNIPLVVEI
jgi:hypothetical protein